jgi:hypothetical protein
MISLKLYPIGLLMIAAVGCTGRDAQSPSEANREDAAARSDLKKDQAADSAAMRKDQADDRIDLNTDQKKAAADRNAASDKAGIDAAADRNKYDAEVKAHLEKVDGRINQLAPKVGQARSDMRTISGEQLKRVRDDRAAIEKSRGSFSSVADDHWDGVKADVDASLKKLDANVDELERLVTK